MDNSSQFGLADPQYLFLLLIIALLVFVYLQYLRRRSPGILLNVPVNKYNLKTQNFSPVDYLFLIRILTLILIITGLANPQFIISKKVRLPASETDIVFALDISKSMLLEDIKPNRLEALKDVLGHFVAMRSRDKIGIVLYAGESINWCPLTKNYPLLLHRINTIDDVDLSDGTAIGTGISSAINILKESTVKSKLIILLTDGESNAGTIDPLLAARFARRLDIKIYTIGIGSTGFAQMPLIGLNGQKYYQKIYVKLNDSSLRKIAAITGASYNNATDARALQKIYDSINKLETKKTKLFTVVSYNSCFAWFIEAALVLLFLEIFLRYSFLRTWPS